ncbi:TerC/Alx family metal homeostasis membrane protein [Candidatus Bandiella euplotis]|uniref:TerC/Alx family metal homeostasis membrane protein n=1 Tax=Candidatus Bandiella euplotis TaxID=1664265 RepID=A0ABZ0UPC7_9RICK|nr:TerC/Alx family metal homeostasis membrane protein [Candidatus Bandiella woodruffii]WPX96854.1 Putative TerC/Alx family metal homeostasis membrane protein [Candidatus Bandiella woodruffii]
MFPSYYWVSLIAILVLSVFVDLGVASRNSKQLSMLKALALSSLWVMLAATIGSVIYLHAGVDMAVEFVAAYCIELSLSVDNVFVFILIFKYFDIEPRFQHKVLFIGGLGAIVLRLLMLTCGFYIINMFEWVFLLFGFLLIYSGYKLPFMNSYDSSTMDDNLVIRITKRYFNYSQDNKGGVLYFHKDKKLFITPLALALLMIEKADLVFAMDSVPAVLAITKDPFIAFSSNILAILGLRSMYFVMSNAIQKFKYLKYGIGGMLVYIGAKMILGFFGVHFSNYISILVTVIFIALSVIFSMIMKVGSVHK